MAYVKRSGLTGKTRRYNVKGRQGAKLVLIADDNGKQVIVSRRRLHRESVVYVDRETIAPSDKLTAYLDGLLAKFGKGE